MVDDFVLAAAWLADAAGAGVVAEGAEVVEDLLEVAELLEAGAGWAALLAASFPFFFLDLAVSVWSSVVAASVLFFFLANAGCDVTIPTARQRAVSQSRNFVVFISIFLLKILFSLAFLVCAGARREEFKLEAGAGAEAQA
jgi:hypothetical protein